MTTGLAAARQQPAFLLQFFIWFDLKVVCLTYINQLWQNFGREAMRLSNLLNKGLTQYPQWVFWARSKPCVCPIWQSFKEKVLEQPVLTPRAGCFMFQGNYSDKPAKTGDQ